MFYCYIALLLKSPLGLFPDIIARDQRGDKAICIQMRLIRSLLFPCNDNTPLNPCLLAGRSSQEKTLIERLNKKPAECRKYNYVVLSLKRVHNNTPLTPSQEGTFGISGKESGLARGIVAFQKYEKSLYKNDEVQKKRPILDIIYIELGFSFKIKV